MGKNLQKQYPFRTDETIIKKIDYIAELNTRNRNQQIEHLLKECINQYEAVNGKLIIEEDGNIIQSKPSNREKSSAFKTG